MVRGPEALMEVLTRMSFDRHFYQMLQANRRSTGPIDGPYPLRQLQDLAPAMDFAALPEWKLWTHDDDQWIDDPPTQWLESPILGNMI